MNQNVNNQTAPMEDETPPTQDECNQAKINTTKRPKTTPNKNGINEK